MSAEHDVGPEDGGRGTSSDGDARALRPAVVIGAALLVAGWIADEVLRANTAAVAGAGGDSDAAIAAGLTVWALVGLDVGLLGGVVAGGGLDRLRETTGRFRSAVRDARADDGANARVHTAAGFLVGIAVALLFPPALDGVIAITLFLVFVTPLEGGVLGRWMRQPDRIAPRTDAVSGALVAIAVSALMPWLVARLVLGAIAAVVVVTSRPKAPAATAVVVVVGGLALLYAPQVRAADARQMVSVPGNQTVTTTNIAVDTGQQVTIEAKGSIKFIQGDDAAVAGPDGGPAYYGGCDNGVPCGSLLAQVNADGPLVAVGTRVVFVASQAGNLQFVVNDFDVSDNEGSFDVTVTVTVAPAVNAAGQTSGPLTFPGAPSQSNRPVSTVPGPVVGLVCGIAGALAFAWSRAACRREVARA